MTCYEGTVNALILTIDAKDHYTYNHSNRVSQLSSQLARELRVPDKIIKEIENAASIHDIGKIGIEEHILKKNGKLTPDEYTEMKKHPVIGVRIVQSVPFLEDAIPVIHHHHERYDGNGYPEGLKGEQIPLSSRIVMVADAVDAMMRARPYREALTIDNVMSELRDNAETQFDPEVVDIILKGKVSLE
jgi:putative nucleotidyltransferase with HDIG domain